VLIGLWVLPRTVNLMREAGHILMEGVPANVALHAVRAKILAQAGVTSVHDLHVWSIGSCEPALTAHVVVSETTDATAVRTALAAMLGAEFDIYHVTLQVEVVHDCRTTADPACRAHT
jgi:cobalt-zinc-cadmium efflux system protein